MKMMIFRYSFKVSSVIVMLVLIQSCVEPIDIETETFESSLVVDATITDELKQQEISLTRTYRFEEDAPPPETGAQVSIVEDSQTEYDFLETSPGHYRSVSEFQARRGSSYELRIITRDGVLYTSDPTELAWSTGIDNLYPAQTVINGTEGVAIQIDNYEAAGATEFYKYEYEETYKIVSRYSYPFDLAYINGRFVEVMKTREETTCFNTRPSNEIVLASTSSLSGDNLEGFLVRFIDRRNPLISQRYSILVKQYAISREAHGYYATVNKLAGSESLFSQNQPGFVEGNIFSPDDPEEKVLGFFNVSSVSSGRIFLNYTDYFDELTRPYFTGSCEPFNPPIYPGSNTETLVENLESGILKYLGGYPPSNPIDEGPYRVVAAVCVDCTLLGSNVVPEFWVE